MSSAEKSGSQPALLHPATIDDMLLYRLSRLLAVAGSMVVRVCEGGFGITRREWRFIALLAVESPQLSSQLAERARLERPRTSRILTSLVNKKLVRREVGPADRREARLSLTEDGRRLYEALFPLVAQINTELLSAIATEDAVWLDACISALQSQSDRMELLADLPKADRQRGAKRGARAK